MGYWKRKIAQPLPTAPLIYAMFNWICYSDLYHNNIIIGVFLRDQLLPDQLIQINSHDINLKSTHCILKTKYPYLLLVRLHFVVIISTSAG